MNAQGSYYDTHGCRRFGCGTERDKESLGAPEGGRRVDEKSPEYTTSNEGDDGGVCVVPPYGILLLWTWRAETEFILLKT